MENSYYYDTLINAFYTVFKDQKFREVDKEVNKKEYETLSSYTRYFLTLKKGYIEIELSAYIFKSSYSFGFNIRKLDLDEEVISIFDISDYLEQYKNTEIEDRFPIEKDFEQVTLEYYQNIKNVAGKELYNIFNNDYWPIVETKDWRD